ncbi:hypothetical protein ACA910_009959 [Epithemia clementina (nom. ined.)]
MDQEYKLLDIKATIFGLDDIFGTYEDFLARILPPEGEQGRPERKPPDPLQQFLAIKCLNHDAFLQAKRKRSNIQRILQLAMFAAPQFSATGNVANVTSPQEQQEDNFQIMEVRIFFGLFEGA